MAAQFDGSSVLSNHKRREINTKGCGVRIGKEGGAVIHHVVFGTISQNIPEGM